ncbi:50S ribosomal protein L35ae [Candidatus Woesearchaeota archaeon]|nr:50S ribosomal protein L35ae [Candidatus Woesearchaeota archaeon]
MEGVLVNYRRQKHHQTPNQAVLKVAGVASRDKAKQLVGKRVVWMTPTKKELKGTISNIHGNSGALRVHFETGVPGQAIGTKVKIE